MVGLDALGAQGRPSSARAQRRHGRSSGTRSRLSVRRRRAGIGGMPSAFPYCHSWRKPTGTPFPTSPGGVSTPAAHAATCCVFLLLTFSDLVVFHPNVYHRRTLLELLTHHSFPTSCRRRCRLSVSCTLMIPTICQSHVSLCSARLRCAVSDASQVMGWRAGKVVMDPVVTGWRRESVEIPLRDPPTPSARR